MFGGDGINTPKRICLALLGLGGVIVLIAVLIPVFGNVGSTGTTIPGSYVRPCSVSCGYGSGRRSGTSGRWGSSGSGNRSGRR